MRQLGYFVLFALSLCLTACCGLGASDNDEDADFDIAPLTAKHDSVQQSAQEFSAGRTAFDTKMADYVANQGSNDVSLLISASQELVSAANEFHFHASGYQALYEATGIDVGTGHTASQTDTSDLTELLQDLDSSIDDTEDIVGHTTISNPSWLIQVQTQITSLNTYIVSTAGIISSIQDSLMLVGGSYGGGIQL